MSRSSILAGLDADEDALPEEGWSNGQPPSEESGPLFYEYGAGDMRLHRTDWIETIPAARPGPLASLRRLVSRR
ncbi:hypothetical protein [Neomicrococcus lactis]|uniref:hypothetical protein n=1 Tax=Neomicrococcus lactis TaxID=732241 RepID=UPI002301D2D2|nr:hypothetical protein [Neomicrococcus lactis]